ncbi:ty3-gypsy retrotransposon protein [Cucumis melo var. makuwa]|uniref:Ty3-gypsy retrotransposon protein n=1 Tax=Cucumis melo var. makuwa TaxID=1194695 RepID=A0A5A7URL9_CUCMM|nr:ty3-gypsy retrotransposon protein [Cucumis melo var. makuwa]
MNGLIPSIRAEVAFCRPKGLAEMMQVAQLVENRELIRNEANLNSLMSGKYSPHPTVSNKATTSMTVAESKGNTTFPIQTITLRSSNANEVHRETNTRRLPNADFQPRREKELCFRCNEKYSADHKCKMKELHELRMFVVVNENEEYEIIEEKEGEEKELAMMVVKENNKGYAKLSINSVIGLDDPGTMKVRGKLHDEDIIILIDCGATHNFLLEKLVEKLQIPTKETTHYGVILGSDTAIQGKGVCEGVEIQLENWKLKEEFLPLELGELMSYLDEGYLVECRVMEVTNDQKKEWQCTDALIVETNPVFIFCTQPMFIAMVLTKLNSPLRLKLACLLDTLCTNKAIYSFSHPHVNTLSPWMSTFLRIVSSYLGLLQGESVSEESNYVVLLESTYLTLVTLPDQNFHTIDLHTNRVLWKIYYKWNFKKEVGSFAIQLAPVQDSEPLQDQGNISKYDPSLDLSIALRKGTRSCTNHSISNYGSYENLSPQFRAFTASLDSATIPKNIHLALELKQSSRAWFDRFTTFVKSQGYNQGHFNHTLFTKVSKTEKITVLIVYVDEIVLSGNDTIDIIQLKKKMGD